MKKAVLFVLFLSLSPLASAQGQTVLTQYQVTVFETLMSRAKLVDPTFLQARAQEVKGRAENSAASAISASAGLSLSGGSVQLAGVKGYDQVTPGSRLNVSVDLGRLIAATSGANRAQLDALTASTSAAGRELRVRVLEAYTAYLSAIRQAGNAADVLTVAQASVRQQNARAQAGASTSVDVMKAMQEQNRADADLYDANLRLAVAKQRLASICGLNLGELDAILSGAKPKP